MLSTIQPDFFSGPYLDEMQRQQSVQRQAPARVVPAIYYPGQDNGMQVQPAVYYGEPSVPEPTFI